MNDAFAVHLLRLFTEAKPELVKEAAGLLTKIRSIVDNYRDDPVVGVYKIQDLVTPKEDYHHG